MKKIILIVIGIVILIALCLLYFSKEIKGKMDEQEVYPCECHITFDTTIKK
jgi:uncharacterized protein YxeA